MKKLRLIVLAAAAAAAGCGDSLDVNNVDPKGSVGGVVVDAVTRQPLADVEVTVVAGGRVLGPEITDETGAFSVGNVAAGDVLVSFAGPSPYQGAYLRGTLSSSAGEFPTGNATLTLGPIGLVPLTDSFGVRVLDEHGKPVSDYPVTIHTFVQYVDLSSGSAASRGETTATATTDGNGYARFDSFPDFFAMGPSVNDSVVALLPPRDPDGDGILDYPGGDRLFAMRSLGDPTPDVILDAGYTTQLQIRASTIPALAGAGGTNPAAATIGISDSIHVAFNLPIQEEVDVVVGDENGDPVETQPSLTVRDDNLTIDFGSAPLLPGREYNVSIHAVSAVGTRYVSGDFAAPFFTRSIDGEVTVMAISRDAATQRVDITFSEPIGLGNGTNNTLSGGNCVLFFNADLGGSATIGDYASELGASSCNIALSSNEPDPTGPAGLSGYTRHWYFFAPTNSVGNPLPSNTRVHVLWDRVTNPAYRVERPDGTVVANMTDGASIPIP